RGGREAEGVHALVVAAVELQALGAHHVGEPLAVQRGDDRGADVVVHVLARLPLGCGEGTGGGPLAVGRVAVVVGRHEDPVGVPAALVLHAVPGRDDGAGVLAGDGVAGAGGGAALEGEEHPARGGLHGSAAGPRAAGLGEGGRGGGHDR